jgi:hypothetical protein
MKDKCYTYISRIGLKILITIYDIYCNVDSQSVAKQRLGYKT